MSPRRKKINILVWAVVIGSAVVIVAVSFILYQHTVNLLTANLRQRIESIARSAAPSFNPKDVEELQVEYDWQKPAWGRVVNQLLAVEQNNKDILFAYIFRKKTDQLSMEFVADSHSINPYANTDNDPSNDVDANRDGIIEPDGPDYLQWPGQDYEDPPEGTFRAYGVGPTTSKDLYEDSFGRVITGYAPIVSNGQTIAVLAFDLKADDFFTITHQTLYPFLSFILFLILIIFSLFYFIIRMSKKQLQKEVAQREKIEGLAGELSKANDKLWVANEKLSELDKMKTEFVSMATHQLRSPLTAIKGYASMLLENSFGPVETKARGAVEIIFQSSQKLVQVIEDFLNITRIDLGTMKYEKIQFDFGALVNNVVTELKPNIEKRGLKFSLEIAPKTNFNLVGDSGKLSQVISNLIDNAIKYTPPLSTSGEPGTIRISLDRAKGKVRLTVADNGAGIPAATIPKLFQKFIRADDAGKLNITGTGLGLYVAKQIMEAHNGKIWAEADGTGRGSRFIVEV